MQTAFCKRVGVALPIIQAPMGGAAGPALAAAVSNAGGLGMLVPWRAKLPDVRQQIREVRSLTSKPFGVNLNLEFPQEERLEVCLEEGAPVISFFWRDPSGLVPRAKAGGAIVLHTVGSAADAKKAVDAGVDIIVAQGWEAGGHVRGTVATLALVPAVVDAVSPTPVIAAGGIADGRGLAAVLALGAAGAWIGTRFLASREATIHPRYRELVLGATENDTIFAEELFDIRWPKAPHRVLRNKTVDAWEAAGRPPSGQTSRRRRGHCDVADQRAGRSLSVLHGERRHRGRHRCAVAVGRPECRPGVEGAARSRDRARDCRGSRRGASAPWLAIMRLRRRDFIGLLCGASAAWPSMARAQGEPARRIGALINRAADDREAAERIQAFDRGLKELGWTVGDNLRIEYRYASGSNDAFRQAAKELIEMKPDVVLASGTQSVAAFQSTSRSIPIVFTSVSDPLGSGFVDSIAKPGGNTTGFMLAEFSLSAKLLELLKQIVPGLTRAAVLRNQENPTGIAQFGTIQAVAPSLGVEVVPINVRDAAEIERAISAFSRSANGGLIVTGSASATIHHELIIALAARYRLPAIYFYRGSVVRGGLISYGPDVLDQFRRAAAYVDRILKGEKPSDLPVQAPTRYVLAVNLKTAKALGLALPDALLGRADEVIE